MEKSLTATTQECCEQYWTSPGGSTPQNSSCTPTYYPSWKLSKLEEPDMWNTAGEVGVIWNMPWIFGSFLVTPCALVSCHILLSKQDSAIRAFRSNRCVTRRKPRDENHAVSFRQSAENRNRAKDMQQIRGVSVELVRGCKRWHPLAPARRYGKRSSLLV